MTGLAERIAAELDIPYELSPEAIGFYRENGYVKLQGVFSPELLEQYRRSIHARVAELSADAPPMEQRSTARLSCRS